MGPLNVPDKKMNLKSHKTYDRPKIRQGRNLIP